MPVKRGVIPNMGDVSQATRVQLSGIGRGGGRRTRTRRARKTARRASGTPRKKRARRTRARPARLVKGSAAAKRYMASIRRKRRR